MKISFHGAARMVTGSKHLLELTNGKKILLDCGMYQGMGQATLELNSDWGFEPKDVAVVVLSHAHIDHIGLLPKLVKDGFAGKIYCTPATAALVKILLIDSARIQEADVMYVNKHRLRDHKPLVEPLYTEGDAQSVFLMLETVPYNERCKIITGVELMYTDAGHILGSAAVHLKIKENGQTKQLTFSGDIGRYNDLLLHSPQVFPQADYIILESTYGDRLHDFSMPTADKLLHAITHTCISKKGKLILPAFSLGRTQQILYLLNRLEQEGRLPKLRYFVDSPLSIKITEVCKQYTDYYNTNVQDCLLKDEDVFQFHGLEYIESVMESKQLNVIKEPCVIISASGMAEAGRVKHHIANNVEDNRNTICLTGYCEPTSLGGRLKNNPASVTIFGKSFMVEAEVMEIASLSAHGDYNDLCQWLSCQDATQVKQLFLVHGDYDAQVEFQGRLKTKGFKNVDTPELHNTYDLE